MNKASDLIALAIEAYRSGELDSAAKFFATALGSEDLDSFVTQITRNVPRAALTGPVTPSENTISPSLASGSDELSDIVDVLEASFRAECSFLDSDEQEGESRASYEDDDEDFDHDDDLDDGDLDHEDEDELEDDVESDEDYEIQASEQKRKIVATVGPVRLKK